MHNRSSKGWKRTISGFVLALFLLTACQRNETAPSPAEQTSRPGMLPDGSHIKDLEIGDVGVTTGLRTLSVFAKAYPTVKNNLPDKLIAFGKLFMGAPYVYGSERYEPSSFDCSDFVHYALLGGLGMEINAWDSRSQWEYVKRYGSRKFYRLNQARKGDILFFMNYTGPEPERYEGIDKSKQIVTHCGIYAGNGFMLHTGSAPVGVRLQKIAGTHLEARFLQGGTAW